MTNDHDSNASREELALYPHAIRLRHVSIFGLGMVGSHVANLLACWGIRRATLVDLDHITHTNAPRMPSYPGARVISGERVAKSHFARDRWVERVAQAGELAEVAAFDGALESVDAGAYRDADVIAVAVDRPASRQHAIRLAHRFGKRVVAGAIDGVEGTLVVDDLIPGGPCHACLAGPASHATTTLGCDANLRMADERRVLPATPPLAAACAALMVQRIADILAGLAPDESTSTHFAWRHHVGGRSLGASVASRSAACPLHDFEGIERHAPDVEPIGVRGGRLGDLLSAIPSGSVWLLDTPFVLRAISDNGADILRIASPAWAAEPPFAAARYPRTDRPVAVLDELSIETAESERLVDVEAASLGLGDGSRFMVRLPNGERRVVEAVRR